MACCIILYHAFSSLSTVKIVGYVRTLQLVHKLNQYTLDSIVLSVQISEVRMQIMSLCYNNAIYYFTPCRLILSGKRCVIFLVCP